MLSTKAVYNDLFTYGLNNVVENDYYFEQPRYMSDYYLRNASFVRCDNITLGYTWDNLLNDKLPRSVRRHRQQRISARYNLLAWSRSHFLITPTSPLITSTQ